MGPWELWGKKFLPCCPFHQQPCEMCRIPGGTSRTLVSETAASSYLLPHSGRAAAGLPGGLRLILGTPRPPTASHSSIWWKRHAPATAHQTPLPRGGWAGTAITHEPLPPASSQVGHVSAQAPNPSPGSHGDPQVVEERTPAATTPCDPVPRCPHPANKGTRFQHPELCENHTRKGSFPRGSRAIQRKKQQCGRGEPSLSPSLPAIVPPQQTASPLSPSCLLRHVFGAVSHSMRL